MPDIQPSSSAPQTASPVFVQATPQLADDVALGCECADPHLQIERWDQESAGPGSEAH